MTTYPPDFSVTNLGPHASTQFALFGHTLNVTASSEAGKSMLFEALSLLLTGTWSDGRAFPKDAIRDGANKTEVSAAIPGVGVATVGVTRAGEPAWALTSNGATERALSRRGFLSRIGRIGEIPDVARFVMTPFLSEKARAEALIDRELGRPLRDLLLSALPPADLRGVVARLMTEAGQTLRASDPLDMAALLKEQTKANSERDQAAGALANARAHLAGLPAPTTPPTSDEIEAARAVLAARDLWSAYGTAAAECADAVSAVERYNATRAALEERASATLPAGPDEAAVADARATIDAAAAWTAYDRAIEAHRSARSAQATAEAERDRRRQARAALGDRPAVPALDPTVSDRLAKAPAAIASIRDALDKARGAFAIAEADVARHGSASDVCPTCERAGWKGHEAALAEARARVESERAVVTRESERLAKSEAALADLRAKVDAYKAAANAAAAYDRELSAIGPDPEIPTVPAEPVAPAAERPDSAAIARANAALRAADEAGFARNAAAADKLKATEALARLVAPDVPAPPRRPDVEQPSPDAVADAESVLASVATAEADARHAAEERAKAERAVADRAGDLDSAEAEAVRVATLVSVRRQAPTVIARQQRAAFDLPDWIGLRFPPKENAQTPEVEVLIDGRPWFLASTGKRVLTDLYFRAAVRRAAGLDMLPLFLDVPMAWSGEFPEIERVVYLWTTPGVGEGIGVEYVGVEAA